MYSDLVPLLTSRGLPLGANCRLYSAWLRSVMLHGSETWQDKEEYVMRLLRNDARMIIKMCNVRSEDKISAD